MQVKTTSALEQELSACANFHQFLSENAPAQQTPALIESIRRTALLSGKEAALRKLERAKNYLLPEVYEKLRRQYTPVTASGGGVGGGRALAYLR